jgi:hypothetical protein
MNKEHSVTIEAHLQSITIDGGEPIEIPKYVKNVSQFADWFTDKEIGNPIHLGKAITILQSYLRESFTNQKSFDQVRNRK